MDSDAKQLLNIALSILNCPKAAPEFDARKENVIFPPPAWFNFNSPLAFSVRPVSWFNWTGNGGPPLQWMPFKDPGPFDLLPILPRVSSAFNSPSRVKSTQLQGLFCIFQPGKKVKKVALRLRALIDFRSGKKCHWNRFFFAACHVDKVKSGRRSDEFLTACPIRRSGYWLLVTRDWPSRRRWWFIFGGKSFRNVKDATRGLFAQVLERRKLPERKADGRFACLFWITRGECFVLKIEVKVGGHRSLRWMRLLFA